MQKDIFLNAAEISGEELYNKVESVILAHAIEVRARPAIMRFCKISGLSRSTLHRLRGGEKPSFEVLMKVARGLVLYGCYVVVEV